MVANKADLAGGAGEGGGGGDYLSEELNALAAEAGAAPPAAGAGAAGERGGSGAEGGGRVWKVSCKTKEGLEGFMEHLEAEVRSRFQGAADDESPLITRCVWSRADRGDPLNDEKASRFSVSAEDKENASGKGRGKPDKGIPQEGGHEGLKARVFRVCV